MRTIIFFDLETISADPDTTYPIEVAAYALDAEFDDLPIIDGGFFHSRMRPPLTDEQINDPTIVQDSALYKNKTKREDIIGFPETKIVWKNFAKFCASYKWDGEMPVAAGWNIKDFDLLIVNRLNKEFKTTRFFQLTNYIDLMNLDWIFRQRSETYASKSFDAARAHFGITLKDGEQSHTASVDVRQGVELLQRYIPFCWNKAKGAKYFKDALANDRRIQHSAR